MNMKKISLILKIIAVTLTVCILPSCGNDSSENDVTKVTVWSGNTHQKAVIEPLIKEWNRTEGKEKGIYIDYQFKGGGTITQVVEMAFQNDTAPEWVNMTARYDELLAIEDLPGGAEYIKEYCKDEKLLEKFRHNGKTYGLPTSSGPQGLIYNKDMFKAAGIVDENGEAKPPETWDEVREYARRLTNPKKKEYGIILPMKWDAWFKSDILHAGMSSVGHLGFDPVSGKYDYSGFVPIMECFLNMRADGSVYPGAETIDNDPARALFSTGKIGMKFAYCFDAGVLNDQFPAECDWGVAPYPVLDKNNKYKQRMRYSGTLNMTKKSLETVGGDVMLECLKLFTSDWWIGELYKGAADIPYDKSKIENIDIGDSKTGWKEFCDLLAISAEEPAEPKSDTSCTEDIQKMFIKEVWSGKKSTKQFAEDYAKIMNDCVQRYYDENPEESFEKFINPDWNIKR